MKKNKKLLLAFGTVAAVLTPIATVISCGSSGSSNSDSGDVFNQGRRTLVQYQSISSFAGESNRVWDMSAQANSLNSRTIWDMTMTTLFRQAVTQSSVVTEEADGTQKEEKQKQEKWELDGAASVATAPDGTNFTDHTDVEAAFKDVEEHGVKAFKFTVPKGIHYIDSTGKETKYEYKAIDYLYGFLRNLYSSEEVREHGTIKGIVTGAPSMETDYQTKMKKDSEWYPDGKLNANEYDNGNVYLLNLFGVDIKGTIDANTGASHSDDAFILKMKEKSNNTAFMSSVLGNTNIFTPISSQKIRELNGLSADEDFTEPGNFTQLLEFGKSKRTNYVADLSGLLTVGKYYFSQYDVRSVKDGGTGIIIEKNEHSANEEYNKNDKTLLKFVTLVHEKGDEDTFAQERQRSFLDDNSESILYQTVTSNPTLMEPIKGDYTKQFVSSKSGGLSQGLMNPYYMINGNQKLDNNTSKLLFGTDTSDANTSKSADDEYFFGRGRQFRALLNTSANLFTLSKISEPEGIRQKTARNYEAGQPITTASDDVFGDDPSLGTSINSISDEDAQKWYSAHTSDTDEALKPTDTKYVDIKSAWKTFLDQARKDAGLAANAKFVFPLYDYRASDATETSTVVQAFKTIVSYLNKITEGNNIEFVEFDKSSGDKETNIINKFKTAPFVYSGAGADYPSVASLIQQHISASYGYTMGAELLANSIDDPSKVLDLDENYGLTSNIDFSNLWDFIKAHSAEAPILNSADAKTKLEGVTLQDWADYRDGSGEITSETTSVLDEIDNIFQEYFLSIAGDEAKIKSWIQFTSNLNIGDKLAMGYPSYSATTTPILGQLPVGTAYAQPWVHLAQIASTSSVQDNFVDLTIDDE